MESKRICCCGVNTWSLVIGWLYSIIHGATLPAILVYITMATMVLEKDHPEGRFGGIVWITTFSVITLPVALFRLPLGILLIQGVVKENEKYLKAWIVFQMILIVLQVIGSIVATLYIIIALIIVAIIDLSISIFCIVVVNIYRRQLLGQNNESQSLIRN